MPKYQMCVVYKEYRWVEVDASNEEEAKEKTWDFIIDNRLIEETEAVDSETELFVDSLIEENANA